MFKKKYDDKEVKCFKCHQTIKPFLKLNRTKSEFFGAMYTGNDKVYWLICPNCNTIIGTK